MVVGVFVFDVFSEAMSDLSSAFSSTSCSKLFNSNCSITLITANIRFENSKQEDMSNESPSYTPPQKKEGIPHWSMQWKIQVFFSPVQDNLHNIITNSTAQNAINLHRVLSSSRGS
jgi:hypothetical protein